MLRAEHPVARLGGATLDLAAPPDARPVVVAVIAAEPNSR